MLAKQQNDQLLSQLQIQRNTKQNLTCLLKHILNTLRTGDADLRFYITTVQDG